MELLRLLMAFGLRIMITWAIAVRRWQTFRITCATILIIELNPANVKCVFDFIQNIFSILQLSHSWFWRTCRLKHLFSNSFAQKTPYFLFVLVVSMVVVVMMVLFFKLSFWFFNWFHFLELIFRFFKNCFTRAFFHFQGFCD